MDRIEESQTPPFLFGPRGPSNLLGNDHRACVALGVGRVLDELELLEKVAMPA